MAVNSRSVDDFKIRMRHLNLTVLKVSVPPRLYTIDLKKKGRRRVKGKRNYMFPMYLIESIIQIR